MNNKMLQRLPPEVQAMLPKAVTPREQKPPEVTLATPFNDVQLISMLAAQIWSRADDTTPKQSVEVALEIVAETIVQMKSGALDRLVAFKSKPVEA